METFSLLPTDTFSTIVIDPPWPISLAGSRKRRHQQKSTMPYRTLSLDEIASFPLKQLANPGCHVYLWTTNKFLRQSFDVLEAWGVRFHLAMPLVKRSGIVPCNGYVFGSEFCLLGFFGKPMQPFLRCGRLNWLQTNPVPGKHSAKPDEFYQLVEEMSPGPRADLFSRRKRDGWTCWGDSVQGVH